MAVEASRMSGTVSKFNNQKGYGFIKPDDGSEDLFVHQSEIKSDGYRSLYEGQKVEFTMSVKGDKYQAIDVSGPNGANLDSCRNGRGNNNIREGGYGGYRSAGDCYTCGRTGHLSRDCDRNMEEASVTTVEWRDTLLGNALANP
ncbi:hypothetical protein RND71_011932 [Anisodus tanguticus]|uniref:Uncharacterized protein n=1 Tax=Anisodus tanguticus TaxID=243964 RepID=A0AAE1VQA1_9SOLA|nr:hypothetical protein RND71_011932 [Anisodus tanguticus]